jgi:hypothetical protein
MQFRARLVAGEGRGMKKQAHCLLMAIKTEIGKLAIGCGESTFQ